jgi:class 3 adenylate cyclase
MSLKSDLIKDLESAFKGQWTVQKTDGVPAPEDLALNSNHAKDLETATVLYADLDGSTNMVDTKSWQLSAEVYKTYLRCAGAIIRAEGGTITAYDGDRVMAIFTGGSKNSTATRCALKINWAVQKLLQPAFEAQYPTNAFKVRHVVGIDTSQLRTARVGVRVDNDLVWIGRAANYAAKLTTLSADTPTWITRAVYERLSEESKYSKGVDMWKEYKWTQMGNMSIYGSTYWWQLSD